jgi:hypothetical protein
MPEHPDTPERAVGTEDACGLSLGFADGSGVLE